MPLTSDETRGSGLAVSIDLINTWDELEPEPDLIEGLTDVRTWLEWHGLSAAAKGMRGADVESGRALRARFGQGFDGRGPPGSWTLATRPRMHAASTSSRPSTGRRGCSSRQTVAGGSAPGPSR